MFLTSRLRVTVEFWTVLDGDAENSVTATWDEAGVGKTRQLTRSKSAYGYPHLGVSLPASVEQR